MSRFHSYISAVQSLSGKLFISAGTGTCGERRWIRPFKGAGGVGEGEPAAPCLFQRSLSLSCGRAIAGLDSGLGSVLAKAAGGSYFLLG